MPLYRLTSPPPHLEDAASEYPTNPDPERYEEVKPKKAAPAVTESSDN